MSSASTSKVAVIGFGLMGAQIAQVLAQSGFSVNAYDVFPEQAKAGLELIKGGRYGLSASVAKGRLDEHEAGDILSRIKLFSEMDKAMSDADLVLEAAVENIEVKHEIFKSAEKNAKASSILATNTSTLSISSISRPLGENARKRTVGMHFFNPPQVMKLVEIIRTNETSSEVVFEVSNIAKRIGKVPISVLDFPGFVANRIGISVFAEASSILAKDIASVRDIDLAMRLGYGYPMGPFELGDLVGLDARLRNMESLHSETQDDRFKPPEILKKLVSEGYLGDPKTKKGSKGGYYEYFGLKKPSEESG